MNDLSISEKWKTEEGGPFMKERILQFFLIGLLGVVGTASAATMNAPAPKTLTPQAGSKKMAVIQVPFIKKPGTIGPAGHRCFKFSISFNKRTNYNDFFTLRPQSSGAMRQEMEVTDLWMTN